MENFKRIDIYQTPKSPFRGKPFKRKRVLGDLFYEHKRRCFYCGILTDWPKHIQGQSLLPYAATIEHLYPKWDIRRALSEKVVLACYKCNNGKNIDDYNKMFEGFTYLGNEFDIFSLFNREPNDKPSVASKAT